MEIKKKKCKTCKKETYIFSKGNCKPCANKGYLKKSLDNPKPKTPIKKISAKYKAILAEYKPLRKEFLEKNPICQLRLSTCTHKAEVIHHTQGKDSRELYLDTTKWLASCSNCNLEVERIGEKAYELKLKRKRLEL